jgi:hypothetical protein
MKDDPNAWNRQVPDYPHWEPPKGRGPYDAPPPGLCPPQREAWLKWRNHITKYSTTNPTEWPGGSHIMDSRTSHTARRRDWIEKNARQMEMVESFCARRGPQCDLGWHIKQAEIDSAHREVEA